MKKLIIITGQHGTGKTIYSNSLGYPVIHLDDHFSYATLKFNWSSIKNLIGNYSVIILDAYMFHLDENLD